MPVTALSYVTVTGNFKNPDGTAAEGLVEFYTDVQLVNVTTNQIVVPGTYRAQLVSGAFSISIPATDDADFSPTGWTWRVRELVEDAIREYSISLPASPSTVDLADVVPASSSGGFTGTRPYSVVLNAAARLALTPVDGDLCVETSTDRWYGYTGTAWRYLSGGTNPTAAKGYATGATSCAINVFTKLTLAGEDYDYGNNFAASTYTAPETGDYRVNGRTSLTVLGAGDRLLVSVLVNGSEAVRGVDLTNSTASSETGGPVSGRLRLTAGDTVDLRVFLLSASAKNNIAGLLATFLEIERL